MSANQDISDSFSANNWLSLLDEYRKLLTVMNVCVNCKCDQINQTSNEGNRLRLKFNDLEIKYKKFINYNNVRNENKRLNSEPNCELNYDSIEWRLKRIKLECNEENEHNQCNDVVVDTECKIDSQNQINNEVNDNNINNIINVSKKRRKKRCRHKNKHMFSYKHVIGDNNDIEEHVMDHNEYIARIESLDKQIIGYRCLWPQCDYFVRQKCKLHNQRCSLKKLNRHLKTKHKRRKVSNFSNNLPHLQISEQTRSETKPEIINKTDGTNYGKQNGSETHRKNKTSIELYENYTLD